MDDACEVNTVHKNLLVSLCGSYNSIMYGTNYNLSLEKYELKYNSLTSENILT